MYGIRNTVEKHCQRIRHAEIQEKLPLNQEAVYEKLTEIFIDQVQKAYRPSVVGESAHEVVRPDVIGPLRSQTQARAVVEPRNFPKEESVRIRAASASAEPSALRGARSAPRGPCLPASRLPAA